MWRASRKHGKAFYRTGNGHGNRGGKERGQKRNNNKEMQNVSWHFLCFIGSRKGSNREGPGHLATCNAVYHTECSILLLGMDGLEAGLGDLMEFVLIEGICYRGGHH